MQTWIDLPFAGGVFTFKLGLEQVAQLEKACDAGLGAIHARTGKGRYGYGVDEVLPEDATYRFSELVEIIKQALIGGDHGIVNEKRVHARHTAMDLIRAHVTNASTGRMRVMETWALAFQIIDALVIGHVPPGEADAGASPAT